MQPSQKTKFERCNGLVVGVATLFVQWAEKVPQKAWQTQKTSVKKGWWAKCNL